MCVVCLFSCYRVQRPQDAARIHESARHGGRHSTERSVAVRLTRHQVMPLGAASRHAGTQICPACLLAAPRAAQEREDMGRWMPAVLGWCRLWCRAPHTARQGFQAAIWLFLIMWLCIEQTGSSITLCCAVQPRPREPFSQPPAAPLFPLPARFVVGPAAYVQCVRRLICCGHCPPVWSVTERETSPGLQGFVCCRTGVDQTLHWGAAKAP